MRETLIRYRRRDPWAPLSQDGLSFMVWSLSVGCWGGRTPWLEVEA